MGAPIVCLQAFTGCPKRQPWRGSLDYPPSGGYDQTNVSPPSTYHSIALNGLVGRKSFIPKIKKNLSFFSFFSGPVTCDLTVTC